MLEKIRFCAAHTLVADTDKTQESLPFPPFHPFPLSYSPSLCDTHQGLLVTKCDEGLSKLIPMERETKRRALHTKETHQNHK